jgi:hypothetical protein
MIEMKRNEMINIAMRTSFTNPKVIELSQQLDELLNKKMGVMTND